MTEIKYTCDRCGKKLIIPERKVIIREPSDAYDKAGVGESELVWSNDFCEDCFKELKKYFDDFFGV